jgi:hypothetical protein
MTRGRFGEESRKFDACWKAHRTNQRRFPATLFEAAADRILDDTFTARGDAGIPF